MPCRASQLLHIFRLGVWDPPTPPLLSRCAFPATQAALDQYWRQRPPLPAGIVRRPGIRLLDQGSREVSALFDKTGRWVRFDFIRKRRPRVAHRDSNNKVKGVIAYEPTEFVFPGRRTDAVARAFPRTYSAPLGVSPVAFTSSLGSRYKSSDGDIPTKPSFPTLVTTCVRNRAQRLCFANAVTAMEAARRFSICLIRPPRKHALRVFDLITSGLQILLSSTCSKRARSKLKKEGRTFDPRGVSD